MEPEDRFSLERLRMVEDQLAGRDIHDPLVLEAMRSVPRHRFVRPEDEEFAYRDAPLPIGEGQTISQPYIVALMTQLLGLSGGEKVLEIGTGSGYQAAVLAQIAGRVYSIERIPELAERAGKILDSLQIRSVEVVVGDGSRGLPEHAPYDGIIVTAAAPAVPRPLEGQLADGGRLVLPVGHRSGQVLERWVREGDEMRREQVAPVAFVPLIGEHGWSEDDSPAFWWR